MPPIPPPRSSNGWLASNRSTLAGWLSANNTDEDRIEWNHVRRASEPASQPGKIWCLAGTDRSIDRGLPCCWHDCPAPCSSWLVFLKGGAEACVASGAPRTTCIQSLRACCSRGGRGGARFKASLMVAWRASRAMRFLARPRPDAHRCSCFLSDLPYTNTHPPHTNYTVTAPLPAPGHSPTYG